jgi:NOL1/NOP2/fmu family ribosome biogenesis protein
MKLQSKAKCVECSRIFDLLDEEQAGEWYYGHDCEPREEGGE